MSAAPTIMSEAVSDGIVRITLNRPHKRNALDLPTREALALAVDRALGDDAVKAIILTGAGGNFCSGGDILSMADQTLNSARARMQPVHRFARSVARSEKPVVAAVQGYAAGAGAGVALLCDVIVAGKSATFSFPFIQLGLMPDCGLLHTLPARVGAGPARRILLTGATVPAQEGEARGLVDHVVADEEVQDEALHIANALAAMPRAALAMIRNGIPLSLGSLDAALDYEAIAQAACMTSDDFRERLAAFQARNSQPVRASHPAEDRMAVETSSSGLPSGLDR